jgi:glycerol-1-phosphate dehydrogenase [NAD(P)+]
MLSKKIYEQLNILLPSLPLIIGEKSLRRDIDDLVATALPGMRYGIVDDIDIDASLGGIVFKALSGNSSCMRITLGKNPRADDETVEHIREKAKKCDALIAVGSGTVNDLCKYSTYVDGKPYIVFPTAASMNGYVSANASITVKGHKTTLPAGLPKAVFCDYGIIAAAPTRLAKSGLGDSLARPTAQADWLLSHLLLSTPYNEKVFTLLADVEAELFENAAGIALGDMETIRALMELLLLSGLGMAIAGGSYPASQGEHMIAHAYNMLADCHPSQYASHKPTLHGEEIGVTALYMAKRQENLLNATPKLLSGIFDKNYISTIFNASLADEFQSAFAKKQELIEKSVQDISPAKWDDIREKIEVVMIHPQRIENILKQSGSYSTPESLGWDRETFKTACNVARFTRDRFTFLDLE